MDQRWKERFQIRPGRWVFVPSNESIEKGRKIKTQVESVWKPPDFYYHLRPGGHIAALKAHGASTQFLKIDLSDFFGSINRSRITRCLRPRLGYATARQIAIDSTVRHPTTRSRFMVPYGYVQSPVLASLCLSDSALGRLLARIHRSNRATVSVYVDDIIVSSTDAEGLGETARDIRGAVERSAFNWNIEKSRGPTVGITAFNVDLSHGALAITQDRMARFNETILADTAAAARIEAIRLYVDSVNPAQVVQLTA